MIYKRATARIRAAGIEHIVVKGGFYGPYPHDPRLRAQSSHCFKTWQEAADAVIGGFRPHDDDVPFETATCANCGEPIDSGPTFWHNGKWTNIWRHPTHGNHTVCDWQEGMAPTSRVATPAAVVERAD